MEQDSTHLTSLSNGLCSDSEAFDFRQDSVCDDLMKPGEVGIYLLQKECIELVNLLDLGGDG